MTILSLNPHLPHPSGSGEAMVGNFSGDENELFDCAVGNVRYEPPRVKYPRVDGRQPELRQRG